MMYFVTNYSFSASLVQHLSYFCFLFKNSAAKIHSRVDANASGWDDWLQKQSNENSVSNSNILILKGIAKNARHGGNLGTAKHQRADKEQNKLPFHVRWWLCNLVHCH